MIKGQSMKRLLLAAAAVFALLAAGAVGSTAHATTAIASPAPPGVQVSRMAYQPGARLPATQLPQLTPVNGTLASKNWSGYVDVACGTCALRFVATSFTLPSLNCANSPAGSYASFWAGLDGVGDSTVEQIGTEAACSAGTASYAAWYEMYPAAPVYFTGISPGDAISMSVYFNAGTNRWQLVLTDLTTGGNISAAQPCPSGSACRNSSAEVIAEAPSASTAGAVLPLADFGQAGFEGIAVTSRSGLHGSMTSTNLWTTDAIDMVGSTGHALTSGSPAYGGQAFTDTWQAAQ